jgi:hypothetical protein
MVQQVGVAMTKKDFELIAKTIQAMSQPARGVATIYFADALRDANPRFDQKRFIQACQPN